MSAMLKPVMDERRTEIRLAGGGPMQAVVLDDHRQPVKLIQEAQVINVSAGGLAMMTSTPVSRGALIQAAADSTTDGRGGKTSMILQVLECLPVAIGRQKLRAKLVEGRMPARLIYHW